MSNGWSGEWRWVQEPDFFVAADALADNPAEADRLKAEIGDWIERDPLGFSEPFPADDEGRPRRYFYTGNIPFLGIHNRKLIVFRIESEPDSGP